jgi:hypothetical protein
MISERFGAANDNYSPGELREQRKHMLLEAGAHISQMKDWIREQREELPQPGSSQAHDARIQEVIAALEPFEAAVKKADEAVDRAEREVDSTDAITEVQTAMRTMFAAHEEAQHIAE